MLVRWKAEIGVRITRYSTSIRDCPYTLLNSVSMDIVDRVYEGNILDARRVNFAGKY